VYYELIILGTLMVGPFHGYLIAKIVQNILGPYSKISAGRLYPLLAKLEEAGLIVVEPVPEQQEEQGSQQRPRSHIPSRRYRMSVAGRERFHELMMDTTSYLGEYQKVFLQKVAYFSFLRPQERLQLIEHYIGYCQSLLSYGTARAGELGRSGKESPIGMTSAQLADLLTGMQHKLDQFRQELVWAEGLREQVKAAIDSSASPQAAIECLAGLAAEGFDQVILPNVAGLEAFDLLATKIIPEVESIPVAGR
jgi:DNA-binding PadR family transcriptional regulator